jgi:hypothetical protein
VLGRHQLGRGIERQLSAPRVAGPQRVGHHPELDRRHHQRDLGGIADRLPARGQVARPAQGGVVAQRRRLDQRPHLGRHRRHHRAVGLELAARFVAGPGQREAAAVGQGQRDHRHLVLGEGPGLVGADDRRRAQGLDRRQPPDHRAAARHALDADRQRDRHRYRQALGDDADDLAYPEHHDLTQGHAAGQPDREHQREQHRGSDDHVATEPRDPALEGRRRVGGGGGAASDPAQLGRAAGRDHHRAGPAGGHVGAGVDHARAVGQRGVGRERDDVLGHRQRLAGQRRLGDLQRGVIEHPGVGRHRVAGVEHDHVARHQLPGLDQRLGATADHPRAMHLEAAQRRQRPLGAALLERADDRVQDHHDDDHQGVAPVIERHRDRRRHAQQVDERARELARDHPGQRAPRHLR